MILKLILIIVFSIVILKLYSKNEFFIVYKKPIPNKCSNNSVYDSELYNFENNILVPKMYEASTVGDKNNRKRYKFNSYTLLNKEILSLLEKYPIKKMNKNYKELYYPKRYNPYNKIKFNKIIIKDINKMMESVSLAIKNFVNKHLQQYYLNYYCNKKKECLCSIINTSLLKLENKNNDYRISMSCEIYINRKDYSHILFLKAEIIDNESYINEIKLIGNRFADKIKLLPGYNNNIENVNIYTDMNKVMYNSNNTYLRDSNENIIIKNDKYNDKLLKKKYINNDRLYSCVGKVAFNKLDCESNQNELSLLDKKGIWDKKCVYNTECPFYQKNKNYPNRRGGCIKGKCEFPLGLKRKSFTKYDKKTKPLCYNCIKGYNCCDDQKNKTVYPNLKTPDYIFKNDFNTRKSFEKELSDKGLFVL